MDKTCDGQNADKTCFHPIKKCSFNFFCVWVFFSECWQSTLSDLKKKILFPRNAFLWVWHWTYAVLQAPELFGIHLLWGLFSAPKNELWWGHGHEKTSPQLVCLSGEESWKSYVASRELSSGLGKTWNFLSFKVLTYGSCFVGTGIVMEQESILGGVYCTLAADLLDNFGQICWF